MLVAGLWRAGVGWALGGPGFPFGHSDPDPAIAPGLSILGGVHRASAAPVIAVLGLLGAGAAVRLARRPARSPTSDAAVGFCWAAAAGLTVVIPDYRLLVAAGPVPILLAGKLFGWPRGVSVASQLPWPVLNQLVCMLGGLLFAAAALAYTRARRGACPSCGRDDGPPGWTAPQRAARWGRWATVIAVVVPLVYAATRWAFALGIPLGVSTGFLDDMNRDNPGIWVGGALLATMAAGGSALTLGLVQRWGEVFPRWIPHAGSRRVPIALAVVPAAMVALMVTSAGLMFFRSQLTQGRNLGEMWSLEGPAIFWPLWGASLAAATLAYYYRRRGPCARCHRGTPATQPSPPAYSHHAGQP
jgi:hypothetical protein